jgi:energy-coupling factor transporter ATP-binding protein EcfA2
MLFRLADRTEVLRVDGRRILFSEQRQKLFELNDAAACLALRLADGATYAQLLDGLLEGGLDRAQAVAGIRDMLVAWSTQGLAVAEWPFAADGGDDRQSIVVADLATSLHYAGRDLSARIAPVFEHLRAAPQPGGTTYHLADSNDFTLISRNRAPAAIMPARQAAPALKALLTADILDASPMFTALHAACLVRDGRALLLCGSPGAGKSTLAAALEVAGFAYGGDDITLMDHGGMVRGVDFALTAKAGSWRLLRESRPDLRRHRIHDRPDGKRVRYLPPVHPGRPDWMPVGWIIRLCRQSEGPAALVRRGRIDALTDLLGEAYSKSGRTSAADIRMLLDLLARAPCHELHYTRLDEAASALGHLCADA